MERLMKKLENREKIFATTSSFFGWTGILSKMKNDVLDFLIFDLEHGHFGFETTENMIRYCNLIGIPAIVRVADTEYFLMSKVLDFGADGILVPRVETVEQAKKAIDSVRFPPVGKKGCGGLSLLRGENAFERFNKEKLIFLQIESPKGVENLPGMMEIGRDEFAGVIIGPTDLTITMEKPFEYMDPEVIAMVEKVLDICLRNGKSCGIFCDGEEQVRFWRNKGMNIIWSGADIGFFTKAYNEFCEFIKKLD